MTINGRTVQQRYASGRKFRVIKAGAHLSGMKLSAHHRNCFEGWRRNLQVGDVIESIGYGPGFGSDPGYGVHFKAETGVVCAEFKPNGSRNWFTYWPAEGWLEAVDDAVARQPMSPPARSEPSA